jgi:hypothetical protein
VGFERHLFVGLSNCCTLRSQALAVEPYALDSAFMDVLEIDGVRSEV